MTSLDARQEQPGIGPAAVTLRADLRTQDREAIRRLLDSTGVFYPQELDVAVELVDDRLAKGENSDYHFLVAESCGEAVGYVCFGPIAVTDRRYDLYWIGVRKDRHGLGIGGRLLREAEKRICARDGKYLYIETSSRPVYEPTRRFYLGHGYREVARVPHFYGDDDDRVIFMKALSTPAA